MDARARLQVLEAFRLAEQRLVGRRAAVAQEHRTALGLRGLADEVGGAGEGRERRKESAVRLVIPRLGPFPLPAVAAQQVEAAVVAYPGLGVRRHVVGAGG